MIDQPSSNDLPPVLTPIAKPAKWPTVPAKIAWQVYALAAMYGVFVIGNFAIVPLTLFFRTFDDGPTGIPFFVLVGMIGAQFGLAATGLVFGPGGFWRRFIWSILAGLFLWFSWGLGVLTRYTVLSPIPWNQLDEWEQADKLAFLQTSLVIPLIFLGLQTPFWLAKLAHGWRIHRPGQADSYRRKGQFAIADLMGATFVIAVCLGLARLDNSLIGPADIGSKLAGMCVVFTIGFGGCLIAVIPAFVFALRVRNTLLSLLLVFGQAPLYMTTPILISLIFISGPPEHLDDVFSTTCGISIGWAVGMGVPLYLVRGLGCRLQWGRECDMAAKGGL